MYLLALFMPFLSFCSSCLLGRFIGLNGCRFLSSFAIFSSFLLSILMFFEASICTASCSLFVCNWFQSELFNINWCFFFDTVTCVMFLVVCGVSCLVHVYSTEYLITDPHHGRFMAYLSLFTGFMLLLVSADNFLVMFCGWEGIGLASFLLIGFWNTRIQAGKSAIKAMLINRIGDLGLAIGICAIFLTFKTLDYVVVFAMTPKAINCNFNFLCFDFDRLTLISFLLFWGAIGKSAQIGLHVWLPDAMEGPTPVSALIHAATLVTAGIFVLVRCSIIFENSHVLLIISFFGALTAFFASTVGLVQNDMKRVIAFSTCSQLGYMSFCASLSHFSIAFFHLANHALFKALLFLSAGCVIHGICDEQDMRKMGGLLKTLPLAYTMILIGSLALVGFPFLTGFYSKDAILEVALSKHNFAGNLAHFLGVCAAFCTSFYSFRLIFLVFVNETNSFKSYFKVAHDAPILMCFPLFFLAAGAIGFGFLSRDFVIGLGSPFFGASLFYNTKDFNLIDSEFLPAVMKNIPFFCTLLGFMLSVVLINCFNISKRKVFSLKMSSLYQKLYIFLTQKWHCDQILNELGAIRLMNFGYTATFKLMDKGIIEILGPSGFTFNVQGASYQFSKLQNGFVANYALFFSVALLFFLLCFCFSIFQLSLFTINNSVVALVFSYFLFSFFVIS